MAVVAVLAMPPCQRLADMGFFGWGKKKSGWVTEENKKMLDNIPKPSVPIDPERKREVEENIKSLDVKPNLTDVSFEAWIMRISLYGKLTFAYRNTDTGEDGVVEMNTFLDRTESDHRAGTLGDWDVKKTHSNMVSFTRVFEGHRGDECEEEFLVAVMIRPELVEAFAQQEEQEGFPC